MTNILKNIDFENIEKHPNILIAARIWDDQRYHAARVCYKFMRMIDDLVDDRKAQEEAITCLERKMMTDQVNNWIECLYQEEHEDPFLLELVETVSRFRIPLSLFHNVTKSMLYDINNDGFESLEAFLDYAEGASVAPASVFVHLSCLRKTAHDYVPPQWEVTDLARPCARFSYIVHIIRDFQQDQKENLNYFALDILGRHGLTPADLKKIAGGAPIPDAFRNMIGEYVELANEYRERTLEVLERLSGQLEERYLFSLYLIFQLYQMVFDRINVQDGEFTTRELNPTPMEMKKRVMEAALEWESSKKTKKKLPGIRAAASNA
ncbi:MAG: phytoene/squalene synthase family protein [Bacteroidales bacterium]